MLGTLLSVLLSICINIESTAPVSISWVCYRLGSYAGAGEGETKD
jgi:hypothetical protein